MADETVNWMLLGVVLTGNRDDVSLAMRPAIDNNNTRAQPWRSSESELQPTHESSLDHNINSIPRKSPWSGLPGVSHANLIVYRRVAGI
jgi:hypothetical protein